MYNLRPVEIRPLSEFPHFNGPDGFAVRAAFLRHVARMVLSVIVQHNRVAMNAVAAAIRA
jgi:hypothetical protein